MCRVYIDDNYVRAEVRVDGKRHPPGVRELEFAPNPGRPNVLVSWGTSTYIKAPGCHKGVEETTHEIFNHIETNATENHVFMVKVAAMATDVGGNFALEVKAEPKAHNHVEPHLAVIKCIDDVGWALPIVGKGDTPARVLKGDNPGPGKSLPGKENESTSASDKKLGEMHLSISDTAFFVEGMDPFEAILE